MFFFGVAVRTTKHPDGIKGLSKKDRGIIVLSNRITANTFDLARHFANKGTPVSIENPAGSLLWKCKHFKKLERTFGPRIGRTMIDYCMYGEDFRKRTLLLTIGSCPEKAAFLQSLSRPCDLSHQHVSLSSWKNLSKEGENRPTKGTAAYPLQLCDAWSTVVAKMLA